MMAETAFRVAYDGPALETGKMPVRDLAPALLALGDLFAEASHVIYPEGKPVALSIKATDEGSFDVHLILESLGPWDDLVDIFGSDPVTALVNLKELIVGGTAAGGGLFWLIKKLRGQSVAVEEGRDEPPSGNVRLTLNDGTTLEAPAEVWTLYRRVTIRRKARQVVAPVAQEGVDQVRFGESRAEPEVVISKADLPAYEEPTEDEDMLLDEEREIVVEIAAPAFIEGYKWRLSDGARTFFATVEDQAFLERVEVGRESFRKGDMLRCRMRIVQSRRADGLHTDYYVTQVIQHIPGAAQMTLNDEAGSA